MNNRPSPSPDFFVAGGTLRSDAPSYVPRPADDRLYHLVKTGSLCYVLTTRQMGKSSLMNRLGKQLQTEGVATALIDLTTIGTAEQEAWYLSLLDDLQFQLSLTTDATDWWQTQASLSPVKRFTKFFRDVLLSEVPGTIAIFIDEVDSALKLDFSDDFFAAIRAIYNQTLTSADAGRLSLVLLGVATPNELIKSQHRTPFNVGERMGLEELALTDMRAVFAQGLPPAATTTIDRVYYWTAGHPYLTQRVSQVIARDGRAHWTDRDVDELVEQLFFTARSLVEESNLQFVNGRVLTSLQKERLLRLYQAVSQNRKRIPNNERADDQTELKLVGLIKVDSTGHLVVRNRIYQHAFDHTWIRQHMPVRRQRILWLFLVMVTILAVGASLYFWQQAQRTNDLLAETYIADFSTTENPTLRLDNLAQLLALGGYEPQAVDLFTQLPTADKIALFADPTADLQPQMERVIMAVFMTQVEEKLMGDAPNTPILASMLMALQQYDRLENPKLEAEIESWVQGRTAVRQNDLEAAQLAYSVALSLNENNPATRFERAQVAIALGEDEAALSDLSTLMTLGEEWQNRIALLIAQTPTLQPLITSADSPYADFIAFLPTPVLDEDVVPVETQTVVPPRNEATAVASPTMVSTPTIPLPILASTPLILPQTPPTGEIVYTCFIEDVDQICTIAADGSNQQQMTQSPVTDWTASYLPKQEGLLFSSARSGVFGIYRMNINGENVAPVLLPIEGDYAPMASPDGTHIVFSRAEAGSLNIWVMDADGRNPHPLTHITGEALSPVWSPDGQQIAFARRLTDEEGYTLVIIGADGSEVREFARSDVASGSLMPEIGSSVDWSPDGQWLAFTAGSSNDHDLYLMAADGSVYYRLTNGGDNLAPSFSPDGNWLVFTSARDGDNDLYLIRLDGSGLTKLTNNRTSDWQPQWGR